MKRQEIPATPVTAQALLDNLEDARCGPEIAERFVALEQSGQHREQLKLLSDHRQHLLLYSETSSWNVCGKPSMVLALRAGILSNSDMARD